MEDLKFTPDGKTLLLGGDSLRFRDVETGKERYPFVGHRRAVRQLTFTPDGRFLASVADGGELRAWGTDGSPLSPPEGQESRIVEHGFSADNELIAVELDGTVRLRQLPSGRETRRFRVHPLAKEKVSAILNGQGWGHFEPLRGYDAVLGPGGRTLATVGADGKLDLSDVATGRCVARCDALHFLGAIPPSPSRRADALWFPRMGDAGHCPSLEHHIRARSWLRSRATAGKAGVFHPESGRTAARLGSGWCWSVSSTRARFPGRKSGSCARMERRHPSTATAGRGSSLRKSDRLSRSRSAQRHRLAAAVAAAPRAGRRPTARCASSPDQTARLWLPVRWARCILAAPCGRPRQAVNCASLISGAATASFALSPDGRFLATAEDALVLRETASGQELGRFPLTHRGNVTALGFSPDGRTLATGGSDGVILLWDWATASGLAQPTDKRHDLLWQDLPGIARTGASVPSPHCPRKATRRWPF